MIPEKRSELEEDDYNFGYAQGWNACVDALLAAPRQPGEMGAGVQWWNTCHYQTLFNAITAATTGEAKGTVGVSVIAFRKAMDAAHAAQQDMVYYGGSKEPEPVSYEAAQQSDMGQDDASLDCPHDACHQAACKCVAASAQQDDPRMAALAAAEQQVNKAAARRKARAERFGLAAQQDEREATASKSHVINCVNSWLKDAGLPLYAMPAQDARTAFEAWATHINTERDKLPYSDQLSHAYRYATTQTAWEAWQEADRAAQQARTTGEVVVTWDEGHTRILAVTRQDDEGQILSIIAEAPAQQVRADAGAEQPGDENAPR